MAKTITKMTALEVSRIAVPGMHRVDDGLYLQIKDANSRSWIHRYTLKGKARWAGLGSYPTVSLADARAKRDEMRVELHNGIDPVGRDRAARAQARVEEAKAITFSECADGYIQAHRAGWRNERHAAQWPATLSTYVAPIMGALPVSAIDTALVMKVLEQPVADAPLWTARPETAARVRGRIESILDWAKAREYRGGENPARWRGHLDKLLPARSKVRKVEHHAALPYTEIGAFMAELRQREGAAAQALEFLILTAARTGEVIGARWREIDFGTKVWTVPATHMKAGIEHRVPLSPATIAVLESMQKVRSGDIVFPGMRGGLSKMSLLAVLARMGRGDLTAHGFRSTFRDWAAERTNYPREVAEAALAHAIGDKVEVAYRRGDLFEKRRRLMTAWAGYCAAPVRTGNVVPLSA